MQVVKPIDIEDALRTDLSAIASGYRFFAPPIPQNLKSGDVLITRVGGSKISGASSAHDVSIDCYASTDAEGTSMANSVHALVTSLPLRSTQTQYSNANANLPYQNFDPRAPQLARYTFRATLTCPGQRITF